MKKLLGAILVGALGIAGGSALAGSPGAAPSAVTDSAPLASDFVREAVDPAGDTMDLDACERWNPEFRSNGMHCCGLSVAEARRDHKRNRCDAHRNRHSYCSERTPEEEAYTRAVESGKIGDVMVYLAAQVEHRPLQAFCSVNTGFLVRARAIVPTAENGIKLRSPERCTNYGTEPMAAMLEWLGRQIRQKFASEYPGIHLLIGDVAAPRGGCLASVGGRRGHKSHAVGEDADVGFVTPVARGESPGYFHRKLQPKPNWWFLKQVFHNPYACVKVVFLDRRQIRKISKVAWNDPDWKVIRRYLHHVRGHRNHFHIRIGDGPGQPGCLASADSQQEDLNMELELENSD